MFGIQTRAGKRGLILRGIQTPGGKKSILYGKITTPTGSKIIWNGAVGTLDVSIAPNPVGGATSFYPSAPVTSLPAVATPNTGTGPFSYAWTVVTEDTPGDWTIVAPTSASGTFSCVVNAASIRTATFRCTVTDARGATGSADVLVSLTNYGSWGYSF